jgi:hypothetical protein
MTKLGIGVGVLATVSCLSVGAKTINVTTVCTENLIRVDAVAESPKLAE